MLESRAGEGSSIGKDMLEKRLAEIIQPTNAAQDRTTSLRIIDSFLAKKNGHDALRQAIRIVKPFFLAVYDKKLQEEAARVIEGFSAHENSGEVLEHYLFNLRHPGKLEESEALRKLVNYHEAREKVAFEERLDPTKSTSFAFR